MKIGVALSGCDIGGVGAYRVLQTLEDLGLHTGMVSCCGLSATGALLYAYGYGEEEGGRMARRMLRDAREVDVDLAVAELAAALHTGRRESSLPVVLSAVNVSDGRICAFTEGVGLLSRGLPTYSMSEAYDALSATISPARGLSSYRYGGCELCDFSVWYGLPVYPLKLSGYDRIISVSFLPRRPASPYEVMVKQRIAASAHQADLHIPILFEGDLPDLESYLDAIDAATELSMAAICAKTLF